MKARNKHTHQECEIFWDMCDMGRKCEASDKPIRKGMPCRDYNAVVDDYEFYVNGFWIDGLRYVDSPYSFERITRAFNTVLSEKRYVTEQDVKRFLNPPEIPIWRRAFEVLSESGKPTEKDIWILEEDRFIIKIPAGSTTAQCLLLRELELLPKEEGL